MIRIFDVDDKTFTSNGDVVVNPLKAIVHKEDNGNFYLELSVGLEYADYITEGRIVVVHTPQGYQAFRIHNPEKTHKRITTQARHVFYDSENYLIRDSYVENQNANYAINHLNSATEPVSEFTVLSDVATMNSFRCVRKSLYEAVQTILERWGGHLVRDNFNIAIRTSIGQDNGVTIRYAKNLKEITCQEDWTNVVTKLLPVGYDGIMLNAVDERANIYITSSVQYDVPYTKTVKFDQDINEEDYETEIAYKQALVDDLRMQAEKYVTENCIPKVSYTLKANVEKLSDVGDTIEVIDERLGINIMTNVIAYDYDCILDKYVEIEFGNFKQNTMRGFASTITAQTNSQVQEASEGFKAIMESELQNATDYIMGMMNDSYVIYDGNQILVVDRLPKEEAVNVIRINSGGIGFSNTGINGTFNSAWLINGTMDMQAINVINMSADLIRTGVLRGQQGNSYWNLVTGELHIEGEQTVDKSKTFIYEPTTPYYVGDLYVTGQINNSGIAGYAIAGNAIVGDDSVPTEGGQIFACKYSRTSGNYNPDDWELITNYVDTSEIEILKQRVTNVEIDVSQQDAKIDLKASSADVTDLGNRVTSAELSIDGLNGEISSKVSQSDYNGASIASLINQSASTVTIMAEHLDLAGKVSFNDFNTTTKEGLVTNVSTRQEYYLSASSSSLIGGSWSVNFPTWQSGYYVWTRTATIKTTADGITQSPVYSAEKYDRTLTTALMTASTANSTANTAKSTADNARSILGAWCYNNNVTYINGGKIYTGTIDADKINVNELSALTADLGTITAGDISGTTIKLGGTSNKWGELSVYNGSNQKEVGLDYNGLRMYQAGTYIGKIGNNIYTDETRLAIDLASSANAFEISNAQSQRPIYVFSKNIATGFVIYDGSYNRFQLSTNDGFIYRDSNNYKRLELSTTNGLILRNSSGGNLVSLNADHLYMYSSSGIERTHIDGGKIFLYSSTGSSGGWVSLSNVASEGLSIVDSNGYKRAQVNSTEIALVDSTNTPKIQLYCSTGKITCVSLTQTSKFEAKKDVVLFENRIHKAVKTKAKLLSAIPSVPETAIDLVNKTQICEYTLKDDESKRRYGVIIDSENYGCCDEIKDEDSGVDIYSMISVLWQAVKELNNEIKELKSNGR